MSAITLSVLVAFSTVIVPASPQTDELWFPTEPPKFIEPTNLSDRVSPLLDRTAYAQFAARHGSDVLFVPIRESPPHLSVRARYGFNFIVPGQNRGYIVDSDGAFGYVLYADLNGNGTVDDRPIRLSRAGNYYTTLVTVSVNRDGPSLPHSVAVQVRFVVELVKTAAGESIGGAAYEESTRSGSIHLDGRDIMFRLSGAGGTYDGPTNSVWIDLNGDGQSSADEMLQVRERHFSLSGTTYEFRVDPFGAGLGLRELRGVTTEQRPSLALGTLAPDFVVVDIDGHEHRLSEYRGKTVLLYFWASWCAPCEIEAPLLKAALAAHQGELVVLGISPDAPALIRSSAARFGHAWSEITEPINGPVTTLYRVNGLPTHYVIDRGGKLVLALEGGFDGTDFLQQLEHQF